MRTALEPVFESIELVETLAEELMRQLDDLGGSKVQEDISFGQYKVMAAIHGCSPVSIGNLSRMVNAAQSTTSEMVARLTRSGIVNKVRGPNDGRIVMVELTDQGRLLMKRRRRRVREGYQAFFDKLGKKEQEKFGAALKTLSDLLTKGRAIAPPPAVRVSLQP